MAVVDPTMKPTIHDRLLPIAIWAYVALVFTPIIISFFY